MDALGIETDELANDCFKDWPTDRKQRARTISNWLQEEAEFLAQYTSLPAALVGLFTRPSPVACARSAFRPRCWSAIVS
jgi:hypothetical protein